MASDEWNAIDQQHHVFEEHYCAFLDILGYKEHSKQFFTNKINLYGRFKRALEHAHTLNKNSKLFVNNDLLKVRFFSDSIVLSHPVHEQSEDAVFNILQMCKVLSTFLSYEGLFLRGAISKGKHFERQDNELNASFLCSEALQEAYELESKHAVYPRILIHEKVIADLSGMTTAFVAKDLDYYFLHFSPQIVNIDGHNLGDVMKELEDIYETYKSCTSLRVQEKYRWLLSYYYWTISLIPGLDIKPFERYNVGDIMNFRLLDSAAAH
jgi:hypothetical protein